MIELGYDSVCIHSGDPKFIDRCMNSEIVIFYRCYNDQTALIQKLILAGKLVAYDIDDFVFQEKGRFNSPVEAAMIKGYLANVNCYIASTKKLLDQMPDNSRPRFVRENSVNKQTMLLLSGESKKNQRSTFRIGWTVGINRREMQDFAQKLLSILDNKNMPGFEFWYFGKMDSFYQFTKKLQNVRCNRLNYIPTAKWKDFYKTLKMCDFDCVINPLNENDIFFNCKSQIKFIETGLLGYPLIVSRVNPFTEVIEEGVNGMFASTPQEFVDKVMEIKVNRVLRDRMAHNALRDVKKKWLVENQVHDFLANIRWAIEENKKFQMKKRLSGDYIPDVQNENFGYVTEPLLGPLIHEFKCSKAGLCRVEYLGGTAGRKLDLPIKLTIKNKNTNCVVHDRIYNARDLSDNSWWGFEFQPVADSLNCIFQVTFQFIEPDAQRAIQFYHHLIEDEKTGKFFVAGKERTGSLAFKSFCSKSVHFLPEKRRPFIRAVPDIEIKDSEIVVYEKNDEVSMNKKRILIKKKGSLGDVIVLTPIINQLKKEKDCQIFVATNHQYIFMNNKDVEGTIAWESNMAGLSQRFILDDIYESEPKGHVIDVYAKYIIGHDQFDKTIILKESPGDIDMIDKILSHRRFKNKEFIVFHKGLTVKNRTWPSEKWKRLEAHTLAQGYNVIVIGSGGDFPPTIPGVINLVNQLTPHQARCLIERAKAIVCIDGDYLQIAGATETPIIPLFFATDAKLRLPYRNGEVGNGCHIIKTSLDCYGCWHNQINPSNYHGCKRGDFICMNSVTPKSILDKLWAL